MNAIVDHFKAHFTVIAGITLGILLIPLLAMQFTNEVNWSVADFVIMGCLIFTAGMVLDMIWLKAGKYRLIGASVVIGLCLWLWAELAVGVFTNWGN